MATPQKEITKLDPKKQYIAAPGFGSARGPRRLPQAPEEIAGITINTYEQMACDPEVAAALLLLVYFILADGLESSPAVGEKDEQYELAQEIDQHIDRTICGLKRPIKDTLEMVLTEAMKHGSKVAEKVYDIPTTGPDAYKLVLTDIKVKPKGATSFVVNEYMTLIGLLPTQRTNVSDISSIIPPEKFLIATFRMKDEDPRGTSLFRPAVKAWNLKQLGWPEFITYAMRCAVPGLVGTLAQNALDVLQTDSSGTESTLTAMDAMLAALVEFKNSTAMAIPNGASVAALEVDGEGEFWERFFTIVNGEITKGILLQELATADAAHQTKGSTETQFTVIDVLVRSGKVWLEEIIRRQIFYPQVVYNWGEDVARELTPKASLGDMDRRAWYRDANAIVSLITAKVKNETGQDVNALTQSQMMALLLSAGIPAPEPEETQPAPQPPSQQQRQAAN